MAFMSIPFSVVFQFVVCIPAILYGYLRAIIIYLFVPQKFLFKKDFTGQTVLITGAGSGLGRQMAILFSQYSTRLVLLDINMSSLIDTQKLLQPNTTSFLYLCDVSDRHKVYELAEVVKRDVGKVDILVNNAGIVNGKRLMDIPDEKILKTMEVNAIAHFWTCKAFLPAMMETNKGHIVSIASLAGKAAIGHLTDYCASKFAAVGLMEALAMEMEAQKLTGVKFTTVCPNTISTGLFNGMKAPLEVMLTPEYVAQEIIYAIREEKEVLILPRFMIIAVVLKEIFPVWVAKLLTRRCKLLYVMDEFKGRSEEANDISPV